MRERTVGAICLGPVNNLQGGYAFMKLSTGKVITKYKFLQVPMTKEIIDRIIEIGRQQQSVEGLKFGNNKNALEDEEITGVIQDDDETELEEAENEEYDDNVHVEHPEDEGVILNYEESEEYDGNIENEEIEEEDDNENTDIYDFIDEVEENLDEAIEDIAELENDNSYTTRYGRKVVTPNNYEPNLNNQR